ncbi:hypothetical protein SAMN05920897_12811 [Alkalispirochaeta americana]|uniref:Uncharacterized protein n=1 Tax=Alkalispirochaeta americana TaxID=159291 RepID=A0A1N6XP99_9SPIO|nr:hypothetical protein SAMN05920897_12811 [Alkalispirochaeta americana]
MKRLFQQIRLRLFPPIGRTAALAIARQRCASEPDLFCIYRRLPANVHIYRQPEEPCWFISAPWNDGSDGLILRSSRLLLISKQTGEVLYDGSANDEG